MTFTSLVQVSQKHSVELLEDPHESDVQELASLLGLRKVVMIYAVLYSAVRVFYSL